MVILNCSASPSCNAVVPAESLGVSSTIIKYTPDEITDVILKHELRRIHLPKQSLDKRIELMNTLLKNEGYSASKLNITSSKKLNLELLCHEVNLDASTFAMLLKHTIDSRKIKYEIISGEIRLVPKVAPEPNPE